MKTLCKALSLLLCLTLLAGCGVIEVDDSKIIVAKVGSENITKAEFTQALTSWLGGYGYAPDSEALKDQIAELKTQLLDSMIQELVAKQKAKAMGYDQLGDEDRAAAQKEVDDWYATQLAAATEQAKANGNTDPEAAAKDQIQQYIESLGMKGLDDLVADVLSSRPVEKLREESVKDVAVTEEDIKANFDNYVAEDTAEFSADPVAFLNAARQGTTYYTPEGIYYVKHILLGFTEEEQSAVAAARKADNDEANTLRDEAALKIKAKADEVLAKVNAGEDFEALIETYGEDPGLQGGNNPSGYMTTIGDNDSYVAEFAEAAQKLGQVGMVSDLVLTDFGYHILKRTSDLPAGPAEYSEDLKTYLSGSLLQSKQEDQYNALLIRWEEEIGVTRYEDRL
ncbi:MAG: peptidylprolyl isomerase [Christensenellaceae bacterium]|jgi:hypothetical protein|nr:peptidylprolyl isomerase [Christensenellaceae bacterium]